MNTPTNAKRANLTLPADTHDFLKNETPNMSEYVAEAVRERRAREKREKALQELLAAAPSFTDVKNGSNYVDVLRREDRERDNATWLSMNCVLDTDVLINFFKHREPETSCIAELSAAATLAISTLAITELRTGWTAEQAAFFLPRLYDLCEVISVTREIAEQTGEWRAQYGEKGRTLGTVDMVIAATAHAQGMSLMTNNTKHYPMPEITLFVSKSAAA